MEEVIKKNNFPDDFPPDIIKKILANSTNKDIDNVYRIAKNGKLNDESFLSTFHEVKFGFRESNVKDDANSISYYSTSCCRSYEHALQLKRIFKKLNPLILKGDIKGQKGPTDCENNNHIDWWIYKNTNVYQDFNIYE